MERKRERKKRTAKDSRWAENKGRSGGFLFLLHMNFMPIHAGQKYSHCMRGMKWRSAIIQERRRGTYAGLAAETVCSAGIINRIKFVSYVSGIMYSL